MSEIKKFSKELLKQYLIEGKFSNEALFQLYVVQTKAYLFQKREHGALEEMQFRSAFAQATGLTLNEIFIVGSAQTGFSIKPSAPLREFDELFKITNIRKDKSDVDVAIVSSRYFDSMHKSIRDFTNGFNKSWEKNVYYPNPAAIKHWSVPRVDSNFYHYFAKGWFRPDLVPDGFQLEYSKVASEWKSRLDRKVSIGIYKEWFNLKDYQLQAFEQLKQSALTGLI